MANELETLIETVKYHNKKYWVDQNPEISDTKYDKLIQRLKELDPNNVLLTQQHSPVSVSGRKIIKHIIPMLSLDKAYTPEEVIVWINKVARSPQEKFSIQPKYDGCSVDYREDGKLVTAGDDGIHGLDISDKIPYIQAIYPTGMCRLSDTKHPIRGEAVIPKDTFKNYTQFLIRKDGKPYKTERNAVVGLLNQKDKLNMPPLIALIAFDTNSWEYTADQLISSDFDWKKMQNEIQNNFNFPTDGTVIKLADEDYSHSLGYTSHHPLGQIALKHGNPKGQTKLIGVEWQLGKQSTLNPVAILEPVEIFGHTITRANLHNGKRIIDLGVQIGDTVVIERCGEIIPDIIDVIPGQERKSIQLECCPKCGSNKIEYVEPFVYCLNPDCIGSIVKKLTDSCQRIGLDRVGVGIADKLARYGCKNIHDVLCLTYDDIISLDGFADTSAQNLVNEIEKIKQNPIEEWKILSSLNIEGVGNTLSRQLMMQMTFPRLLSMDEYNLSTFPMIGEVRAHVIHEFISIHRTLINNLLSMLNVVDSMNVWYGIKGKICITGKPRNGKKYWEDLAEKNGFEISKSVTKDLKYLITSDPNSTSGKMQKAQKFGCVILSVEEFSKLLK